MFSIQLGLSSYSYYFVIIHLIIKEYSSNVLFEGLFLQNVFLEIFIVDVTTQSSNSLQSPYNNRWKLLVIYRTLCFGRGFFQQYPLQERHFLIAIYQLCSQLFQNVKSGCSLWIFSLSFNCSINGFSLITHDTMILFWILKD